MNTPKQKIDILKIIGKIIGGIGLIASLIGIYDFFWKADIFFDNGKRPNLITESKPYATPYFEYKSPNFASILEKYEEKEDSTDSEESILFDVYDKPKPELYKLVEIGKINWDSLNSSNKNPSKMDIIPSFNLTYDFKNIGDFGAEIVLIAMCDAVSYEPVLREAIKEKIESNDKIGEWKDALLNYTDDKGNILKDSVYKFQHRYTLRNINENFDCIVHLNLMYRDKKGKYYDSYLWVKYKFKEYKMQVTWEPHHIL